MASKANKGPDVKALAPKLSSVLLALSLGWNVPKVAVWSRYGNGKEETQFYNAEQFLA